MVSLQLYGGAIATSSSTYCGDNDDDVFFFSNSTFLHKNEDVKPQLTALFGKHRHCSPKINLIYSIQQHQSLSKCNHSNFFEMLPWHCSNAVAVASLWANKTTSTTSPRLNVLERNINNYTLVPVVRVHSENRSWKSKRQNPPPKSKKRRKMPTTS